MKKERQTSPLAELVPRFWWKILPFLMAVSILFLGISFQGINQISPAQAQGPEPTPQRVSVGEPVTPGLSPPVRSLPTAQPRKPGVPAPEVNPRQPGGYVPENTEGSLSQPSPLPQISASNSTRTPAFSLSFDGIDLATGGSGIPPDTVGDVGPNHYVQMVNSSFSIYDKNGTKLTGPNNINSLWTDGTKCQTQNDGDPIVLYDRAADQWLMTQFAVTGGAPYYQCIAISQTADPTGLWYTYSFQVIASGTNYNDYGKFGVWPDGYYMGANENSFTAYVFDRAKMLTGAAATFQKMNVPGQNMMLPSDLDGPTAPPANTPNYYYTMKTGNMMELWAFHVDWVTPGNSTFTKVTDLTSAVGFIYDVCPADPTNDFSFACIPQPGTTQAVDAIGEWPMFRFQYRNHGTHESLVGNFTVDMNAAPGTDQAGIHWFELRKVGAGAWSIQDEGNYAPDATQRWMGSAAMDKDGNIAVGYSVSDGSIFPSIRYATRLATDPAGTLGTEVPLHAGAASQFGASCGTGCDRWGDYSAMSVDPVDDCTFWYTTEYLQSSAAGWRTRIGSFKIPSCGTTTALSITKTGSSTSIEAGQAFTYTITVVSTGSVTTTNILITDTVPTSTTLDAASLSGDATNSGTSAGSLITWTTGVSLAQNQTLSRTFVVTLSATITNGDQIVNTAYVSATNISSVQSSTVTSGVSNIYMPIILKN